jgi:hypothetical protein
MILPATWTFAQLNEYLMSKLEELKGYLHIAQPKSQAAESNPKAELAGTAEQARGPMNVAPSTPPEVREPEKKVAQSRHGPKPDLENHRKVAEIVKPYGDEWKEEKSLAKICKTLDREKIACPEKWQYRKSPARTWSRAPSITKIWSSRR